MQQVYLDFRGYRKAVDYAMRVCGLSEAAAYRAQVLSFWKRHGLEATQDAFKVSRSTLYAWQKRLKANQGRLSALEPASRRPKRRPRKKTREAVYAFVLRYRLERPRVGKETIKPALDRFCHMQGLPSASVSTIGRILTQLKQAGKLKDTPKLTLSCPHRQAARAPTQAKKEETALAQRLPSPGARRPGAGGRGRALHK